jgi:hypothetical protein
MQVTLNFAQTAFVLQGKDVIVQKCHNAQNNHSLRSLRSEGFTDVCIEEVVSSSNILL